MNSFGIPVFSRGRKSRAKKQNRKKGFYNVSFSSPFIENSPKNLIVMYDIPHLKKKEREDNPFPHFSHGVNEGKGKLNKNKMIFIRLFFRPFYLAISTASLSFTERSLEEPSPPIVTP